MKILNVKKLRDGIFIEFEGKNGKGTCEFSLFGDEDERGIEDVRYDEAEDEDVYGEIVDFVGEHIETNLTIKYDGKIL